MRRSRARESTSSSLKHREQGKETPPGLGSSHRAGESEPCNPELPWVGPYHIPSCLLGVRI